MDENYKRYYKFIGYSDGSGRSGGLIIKYLTEEQYNHKVKCELKFEKIPTLQENHTTQIVIDQRRN